MATAAPSHTAPLMIPTILRNASTARRLEKLLQTAKRLADFGLAFVREWTANWNLSRRVDLFFRATQLDLRHEERRAADCDPGNPAGQQRVRDLCRQR